VRPTTSVTGGWGEKGFETENCQSSETAAKRGESQPSGARTVGQLLLFSKTSLANILGFLKRLTA